MRADFWVFGSIVFFLCFSARAVELATSTDRKSVYTFLHLEISTNNNHVRSVVGKIANGIKRSKISLNDKILRQTCERVRNFFPTHDVQCGAVIMENREALYRIDITTETQTAIRNSLANCNEAGLPTELLEISVRLGKVWDEGFARGADFGAEFVNESGQLTMFGADGAKLSGDYQRSVKGKLAAIIQGMNSCDARDRAESIYLMNYTGYPTQAIRFALNLVNDPDGGVRNNATRLLTSFIEQVNPEKLNELIKFACNKILQESFFERNKGLALIQQTLQRGSGKFEIPCRSRIADLAQQSDSGQIGGFARDIERLTGDSPAEDARAAPSDRRLTL